MNFQTNSQQIEPFLWFDTQAEEAVNKYVSLFPNSKVNATTRFGKEGPGPEGSVMTIGFELNGIKFAALNGGPMFKFTEAVSFVIHCKDQSEVDKYWDALLEGGQTQACGWLKDKFGLSWQIIPDKFLELIKSDEPKKIASMMQAMMKMIKLDEAELVAAYDAG
ncbi:VOC family protein [Flavobacterium sp.]|uniref:VOC family protein n=1 Tax=Flavobacterium sp. TaxID=239 RepID=UPI00120EF989|nr:VOC family protein [Flavobacterium sp.]RZJ71697.1 MAG: VOC family protein [Flavobacterium sp.]